MTDDDRFVPVADGPCAGQRVWSIRSSAGNWWIHLCTRIDSHRYRYDAETGSYVYEGGEHG